MRSKRKASIRQREELLQTTREKMEQERIRNRVMFVFQVAMTLVLAALTAIFIFQPVVMQESAMEPTLYAGEKFYVDSFLYRVSSPKRGDIVMFRSTSGERTVQHIRRIVGLPGDVIQIKDGKILINGLALEEDLDLDRIESGGLATNPIEIGRNQYFLLGDNRNNSEDSRYKEIGLVSKDEIKGKIWVRYSPFEELTFF